jgi:hypothetical protein
MLTTTLVASMIAALSGCGGDDQQAAFTPPSPSSPAATSLAMPAQPLKTAYKACQALAGGHFVRVADDGDSIIIDTDSEYGSTEAVECVLRSINTSDPLEARLKSTTASMGTQEASEGGYDYSWSYHPDNGINMVIKRGA